MSIARQLIKLIYVLQQYDCAGYARRSNGCFEIWSCVCSFHAYVHENCPGRTSKILLRGILHTQNTHTRHEKKTQAPSVPRYASDRAPLTSSCGGRCSHANRQAFARVLLALRTDGSHHSLSALWRYIQKITSRKGTIKFAEIDPRRTISNENVNVEQRVVGLNNKGRQSPPPVIRTPFAGLNTPPVPMLDRNTVVRRSSSYKEMIAALGPTPAMKPKTAKTEKRGSA